MTLLLVCFIGALAACAVLDNDTPGWPEFQQRTRNAGVRLHSEEYGRGEPIVFLHGLGLSTYSWRHLVGPLARHYRVILLDLKGFGNSPKPIDQEYTLYDQARLVYQFIVAHDLHHLTLVGHSFGGGVALITSLYLTETSPARQRRLILIDSIAYKQRLPGFLRLLNTPVLGPLLLSWVPEKTLVRSMMELGYYDDASISEDAVAAYARLLRRSEAKKAILQTARQILPSDLEALSQKYPYMGYPTLILWGREDRMVPLSIGQRLYAAIPHSRLVVLERCGHLPHEEQPAATLAAIQAFLIGGGTLQ